MLHTGNFEIGIPKEFLRADGFFTLQTALYDFKYKVTVQYHTDAKGNDFTIDAVNCGFLVAKSINWRDSKLEDYFISAAKNNWESLSNTRTPNEHCHPVMAGILNSFLV